MLHGESGQNVADLTQSGPDGNPLGADGSFAFRDLPVGQYTLMAQHGDKAGVLIGVPVGGARTAATLVLQVTTAGAITGKVGGVVAGVPLVDTVPVQLPTEPPAPGTVGWVFALGVPSGVALVVFTV